MRKAILTSWLLRLSSAALVVVAVVFLGLVALNGHSDHKLEEQLERLRNDGLPLTLDGLAVSRPRPDGADTADPSGSGAVDFLFSIQDAYPDLADKGPTSDFLKEMMGKLGVLFHEASPEPISDDDLARMRTFVSENSELIDHLVSVSLLPPSTKEGILKIMGAQARPLFNAKIPDIFALRNSVILLGICAYVRAVDDGPDAGLALCARALALGDHCRDIPGMITCMVGMNMQSLTFDAAARFLSETQPSRKAMKTFIEVLERSCRREAFVRGWQMDLLTLLDFFSRPQMLREMSKDQFRVFGRLYGGHMTRFWHNTDEVECLRFGARAVELSSQSYCEVAAQLEAFEADRKSIPQYCLMAGIAVPKSFSLGFRHQSEHEAMVSLAVLGLTLKLYHLDHAAFPESLDALVPDYLPSIPPDELTGQPWMYRREGEGFILYSIGANLRDDGGKPDKENGDFVWPAYN